VTGAESSEALAELSSVVLGGLKALHVYSNTGQGRRMPAARAPVQAAWNARDELFTEAQRQQFEGFVSSSKNFAALLQEASPSREPVRRDYVPAPRQQPQPRERRRPRSAAKDREEEEEQPRLSKRQQKRLEAAQRGGPSAAQQQQQQEAEQAAQAAQASVAAQVAALAAQKRTAEEAASKRYKLTFKLGTTNLTGAATEASQDEAALTSALSDHWQWHEQQQQQQQQQQEHHTVWPNGGAAAAEQAESPPPLPADDVPGGWQPVDEAPPPVPPAEWEGAAEPPLSPMSEASSPLPSTVAALDAAAFQQHEAANGSVKRGLDPAAPELAAQGKPAVMELLR
jgi:hypothetical protein